MALPTASDNKFPKLVVAESGTLGTAAAGERRLGIDANGVLVWKNSAGVTSPLVALNKWDATVAPTANEDSGDGYGIGSRWIDVTNDKEYVCLNAAVGAAVWTETTSGGLSDMGTVTYLDFTTAAAPANPAAGKIRVYSKTGDTLAQRTSGGTETVFGAGGGGWTQGINESGTSFANFTSESGTWASNGTLIQQTMTGASARRARHNTLVPHGVGVVIESEMQMASGSTGADAAMGFLIGHAGANAGSQRVVVLEPNSDTLQWEEGGVSAIRTVAHTLALATWYTLRVVVAGYYISAYVDGSLKGTTRVAVGATNADYIGLVTYDAVVDFRNFKVWTPTLP